MIPSLSALFLAAANAPLFGNQWSALGVVLLGVAALMLMVAGAGRWLAATHPEPVPHPVEPGKKPPPVVATAPVGPSNETLAIIAACVAVTFGERARVLSVRPSGPSIEMLMQQWSLEGRRQIYSSHKVR